jgi:type IV pilus assembly protein PilY1
MLCAKRGRNLLLTLATLVVATVPLTGRAQMIISEDFTQATTNNSWYFLNGACLTAGTTTSTSSPGQIPSCISIASSYYNEVLVGGSSGYLGSSTSPGSPGSGVADPVGSGALRFTNGKPGGKSQNGAIVFGGTPFPTGQGVQVTFKTVSYRGDSGSIFGGTGDGADGISFYLMDGSQPAGIGAWGGSLGYSCSNANPPYDGLTGGYLGLGVDEYGNFLNGRLLMSGYTGSNTPSGANLGATPFPYLGGDNTAYGYGRKPSRIGLRGAGSVSWAALNGAYGTDPLDSTKPYYPSSLSQSCLAAAATSGTPAAVAYSASSNSCIHYCPQGSQYYAPIDKCNNACSAATAPATNTYNPNYGSCDSCSSGTYDPTSRNCVNMQSCASPAVYNGSTGQCDQCPATNYTTSDTPSNGLCAHSCPNGTARDSSGNYCYPTGDSFSSGYYCGSTSQIVAYNGNQVCYPNGAVYGSGYYCASGSISGAHCASSSNAVFNAANTYYCASGQAIIAYNGGYVCYPSGKPYASGYYCSTGTSISGTNCCNSGYTYQTSGTYVGQCLKSPSTTQTPGTATLASGATATTAASAVTASTAAAGSQSVAATHPPRQTLLSTPKTPSTQAWSSVPSDSRYAVMQTCATGNLFNWKAFLAQSPSNTLTPPGTTGTATLTNPVNTAGILDYAPIPSAYKELTSVSIANESAVTRNDATVIAYKLKITPDGLLTFSYSTGGAYTGVIQKQNITTGNGPLPASFRFGFAGSTGGSTNVHEVLCFQATPADQASTSIGINQKEAAKIASGTQAYLAYYYPSTWTGRLTANDLLYDATTQQLSVSAKSNWDASCNLTGVPSGQTCLTTGVSGVVAAQDPTARTILSWDGTQGIPFEWNNLSTAQQAALDSGDATAGTANRLNYLRGDRSNEVNPQGVGLFRPRESVLGDIMDSSPTWVGPPQLPYAVSWGDSLWPAAVNSENAASVSYSQYKVTKGTRLNVVYAGANDGLLHAFEAGSYDLNNNYVNNSATPNDGQEVLAYIPGATISGVSLNTGSGLISDVDTIHGSDPTNSNTVADSSIDYSSTQYGHNFFVDAQPGTGDLYYNGIWHTWLVGGLGQGGAAIYALDVTDPSKFSESNAKSLVIGEWTAASISCVNQTNCGLSLGNTYGQPVIRRTHAQNASGQGQWAAMWGNGFGSKSGDAGIFVMTVDPSNGARNTYYLSTGKTGDGIAYVYPADLDGDRVIDYVYAGDVLGNVWRFDLTDKDPTKWAASSSPLFSTPGGQPITSKPVVWILPPDSGGSQRLIVAFGTGQKTPITNAAPASYATGTQSLYGIWDWNMNAWNLKSSSKFYSLTGPQSITTSALTSQTITVQASGERDASTTNVCWKGVTTSGCASNGQFGWQMQLPSTNEQVVYNPIAYKGMLVVNTTIPAQNAFASCSNVTDTGYTMFISMANGGAIPGLFQNYNDAVGFQTDGSGTPIFVNAGGKDYFLTQTTDGNGSGNPTQPPVGDPGPGGGGSGGSGGNGSGNGSCPAPLHYSNGTCSGQENPPGPTGRRLTWIQKR